MEYYKSGTAWEPVMGYSRAVKVGQIIHVSGTTATDEQGNIVAPNDPYEQTRQCLRNIEQALKFFECDLSSVYRTRVYLRNIDHWREVAKAHSACFPENAPASAVVEVSGLISPEILVEIEAEAFWEY